MVQKGPLPRPSQTRTNEDGFAIDRLMGKYYYCCPASITNRLTNFSKIPNVPGFEAGFLGTVRFSPSNLAPGLRVLP